MFPVCIEDPLAVPSIHCGNLSYIGVVMQTAWLFGNDHAQQVAKQHGLDSHMASRIPIFFAGSDVRGWRLHPRTNGLGTPESRNGC